MKRMSRMEGFTLVEVVIAAALMAMAVLSVAIMFPNAHMGVERSGEQTVAVMLAQQQVESLRNEPFAVLTAGTTTEQLAGEYAGYTRTTEIQVDTPDIGLKQVKISVTTAGGWEVNDLTTIITD